jgi:hypothetical protein
VPKELHRVELRFSSRYSRAELSSSNPHLPRKRDLVDYIPMNHREDPSTVMNAREKFKIGLIKAAFSLQAEEDSVLPWITGGLGAATGGAGGQALSSRAAYLKALEEIMAGDEYEGLMKDIAELEHKHKGYTWGTGDYANRFLYQDPEMRDLTLRGIRGNLEAKHEAVKNLKMKAMNAKGGPLALILGALGLGAFGYGVGELMS